MIQCASLSIVSASLVRNPENDKSIPAWRKPLDGFFSLRPVTAIVKKTMPPLDRLLMRVTGGRFAVTRSLGMPTLMLTSTGRKSGLARSAPLLYVRSGEDLAVIGTNFGSTSFPAWYLNLMANPNGLVLLDNETFAVTARKATAEEWEKLWEKATHLYGGYEKYKPRVGSREIPILVLLRT
jgi:deazaflavin-dependent oxidoreductase (nitroreductase family)